MKDYYDILEISRDSSEKEIKKAYRKLALKYHPDTNPDDEDANAKFLEVQQAYEVIGDSDKKSLYDKFGENWEQAGQSGFGGGRFGGFGGYDPFEHLRRAQAQEDARRAAKGQGIKIKISVTLEDCFNGCKRDISYSINKNCNGCGGNGAEDGTAHSECDMCGGSGERIVVSRVGNINIQRAESCNKCRGAGKVIKKACSVCRGHGFTSLTENATLTFPRGVEMGISIRAENKGHYSRVPGGERGDALFIVEEILSPHFVRLGMDLFYKQDISYEDLALGVTLEVPTVYGKKTKIIVKPGTQNSKEYVLRGHGMPIINLPEKFKPGASPEGAFGNFIIELVLKVPELHSEEERELLEQLRNLKNKDLDKVE